MNTSGTSPVITLKLKARGGYLAVLQNAGEICDKKNVTIGFLKCKGEKDVDLHGLTIRQGPLIVTTISNK